MTELGNVRDQFDELSATSKNNADELGAVKQELADTVAAKQRLEDKLSKSYTEVILADAARGKKDKELDKMAEQVEDLNRTVQEFEEKLRESEAEKSQCKFK